MCFVFSYRCINGYCIIFVLHIAVKRFEKSDIVKFLHIRDEKTSVSSKRKPQAQKKTYFIEACVQACARTRARKLKRLFVGYFGQKIHIVYPIKIF
ncbi:MAG TPA: hypothetical protein DEF02_05620 [Clostridiales bacterium]|nr:hypothetical protein [Clostridiales bacterium]